MRADSAILQRLIHMTCWFAPLILRLGANQHLAHPGDIVSATLAPWASKASCRSGWARATSPAAPRTGSSSRTRAAPAVKREAEEDWDR